MSKNKSAVNDRHDIKLRMLTAVSAVLQEYSSVWSASTGIQSVVNQLDSLIADVRTGMQVKIAGSQPATLLKKQRKENLLTLLNEASGALYLYAQQSQDAEIISMGELVPSDLSELREEALLNLAQQLMDLVNDRGVSLEEFGGSNSLNTDLADAIIGYDEGLEQPVLSKTERMAATSLIPSRLSLASALLKYSIDKLMRKYQRTHPEFYLRYRGARKLVRTGVRHETTSDSDNTAA